VTERMEQLYLEDLAIGQRFTSETYVMEAARIKEFAAEFDPQPFHIDESAAEASVFKGLAASGWHTAAVSMRLLITGGLPFANGLVGMGGEVAWPRPNVLATSCTLKVKLLKSRRRGPSRIKASSRCGARCPVSTGKRFIC
jgi:acyl dehydratase